VRQGMDVGVGQGMYDEVRQGGVRQCEMTG